MTPQKMLQLAISLPASDDIHWYERWRYCHLPETKDHNEQVWAQEGLYGILFRRRFTQGKWQPIEQIHDCRQWNETCLCLETLKTKLITEPTKSEPTEPTEPTKSELADALRELTGWAIYGNHQGNPYTKPTIRHALKLLARQQNIPETEWLTVTVPQCVD
jgi:hypothetical protein